MELKDKVKAKLIESLNEDVYKVEHEGHPDADKIKELSHLKPGKKYCNHITKYPDSAKKAAAMLKKNGFQGVKIYKNWQVMEGVELPEVELDESIVTKAHDAKYDELMKKGYKPHSLGPKSAPGAQSHVLKHKDTGEKIHLHTWQKSISDVGQKVETLKEAIRAKIIPTHMSSGKPNPNHPKYAEHKAAYDAAKAAEPKKPRAARPGKPVDSSDSKLHSALEDHLGGSFEHFEGPLKHYTTKEGHPAAKMTVTHSYKASDFGYEHDTEDMAETHHVTAVRKGGKYEIYHRSMREGVELDEGKMSEIASDIGDHMDKHIANYKRVGGAESLMSHAARATPKIAKLHGIEHKHAEKFVSDYIDSKLHEEAELEEAYTVKTYKGSPDEVSKHLGLAAKSSKTKIRNDGTIEVHEKSGNGVNIHNVWSEDEGKTSKYTVKSMSAALYKKNHGKLDEGLFAKKAKPDAMDDVYAKAKAHVAVKHPGWKLASLGRGDNGSINYEVMHPTTGATREGVIKEETLSEEIKIGDSVHVGLVKKGGTGFEGVVTHMDQANNKITLRSHTKEKFGHRTFQGRLSNASVINK